ncbi:MAG: ABC transporter substrate-binding protein [Bacillota bacterium]
MQKRVLGMMTALFVLLCIVAVGCAQKAPAPGGKEQGGKKSPLGVDVIKIGGQGALSGSHADYGRQMQMGATLAAEEINAAGGIMGAKIELKFMDEELKPPVAQKNARYLVKDWGANFLVGIDSSGSALALGPVLKELNTIQFFTHAGTEKLTEDLVYKQGIKQIFRMTVPVYQDAILPALVFKDMPELKRFAALNADYEYGHTSWKMFKETLSKYRPDVEFVAEANAPFGTTDFSAHISKLLAANPDVIFATPWAGEAVTMLRQAQAQGVFDKIKIWWQAMGGSVDVMEALSTDIQKDAFKGKLWGTARYLHNWPDTPENRAFVQAFLKRWARYPNYSAEASYSSVYALKAAIEKAGSIETDKVIKALEGMKIMTPAGERYIRPEDHQAVYTVPMGRAVWSSDYPIAIIGDLKVVPAENYYRKPPFN